MKQQDTLIAGRALARHSELLATRPPEAGELARVLAGKAVRLESALSEELADLLGSARATVRCGKVEKTTAARLHKIVEPVAANFLLDAGSGAQIVASLDYHAAMVLTDQVFGGEGDWSADRPEVLPVSADLTLQRLGPALGGALASLFGEPAAMTLSARSAELGKFVPAVDGDTYLLLSADIAVGESQPWRVLLVLREAHAALLLEERDAAPGRGEAGDRRRPDAKPFADVPLPLTAVLARMQFPVSRIAGMRPGDTIPLALARDVSLLLAETEIARGEVGAHDGALALRLTSIAWNSPVKGNL